MTDPTPEQMQDARNHISMQVKLAHTNYIAARNILESLTTIARVLGCQVAERPDDGPIPTALEVVTAGKGGSK